MVIAEAWRTATIAAVTAVLICAVAATGSPLLIGGACLVAAEAVFALWFQVKKKRLDAVLTTPGPNHDAKALMRKCIARITYSDDYLSSWFDGAPRDQIHKQNLREFMAYGFWFKQYDQLSDSDKQFMEQVLKQLEKQTGVTLPEGRNPDIQFLSHLWDPLKVSYKPLIFYIGTELLALLSACTLWAAGFRRHCHNGDVFYTYRVTNCSSSSSSSSVDVEDPLLFVHGVGAGLTPYLLFVFKLWLTGRPLILPEYKHISMRCTTRIPSVQECAQSVSDFLNATHVPSVHVMAHSYGTLVGARFAISFADKVSSLALMDPVCFAMYMPRLIRTFLYAKSPNSGNWLLDQALLMVAKELHCAATFCRQFLWHDYNMWPERLPARTLVALSGGDVLCPADDVRQHLEEETAARVVFHPTLYHGAVLLWPSYADMVIKSWQQMLADPAPAAAAVVATAAAVQDLESEPVLLHGTAAATTQDEEQQQQQQEAADVSVVVIDQNGTATQQQQLQAKQQLWQQQWQECDDIVDVALDAGSKLSAAMTTATAVIGIKAVAGPLHSRQASECPSGAHEELSLLGPHSDSLESPLESESLSAAGAGEASDDDDSNSSGCSNGMQCQQCRSGPRLQQRQSLHSNGHKDHWVQLVGQGHEHLQQSNACISAASNTACHREGLAVPCDCCCEQQLQQQVVEA